ncbi:MAG: hypothetical protein COZ72_02115 [Elusimicrobia bacterium CG_4_8_14_3_um_filter_50_9]|nr:MAG: hypothetical protein COZ72_02115 [Elusimicrobia bacterium CG_4_8_14_3_um_filter_50_9]
MKKLRTSPFSPFSRKSTPVTFLFILFLCAAASGVSFQNTLSDIFNYRLEEAAEKIKGLKAEEKHYARALYLMHRGLYSEAHDEMIRSGAPAGDRWRDYIAGMKDIGDGFETEHIAGFNVRFYIRDRVMLPYLRQKLPLISRAMKRIFAFSPGGVVLEIYPDREKFLKASTLSREELERSGTVAIAKFSRLMILSPRLLPYGYRWDDTVCHEYTHHIIGNFTEMDIPLYLNEGIARTFENLWRKDSPELEAPVKNQLARAKSEGFIEFKKFERGMPSLENQKDVALAFAQVNYLVYGMFEKGGAKKIQQMLIGCGREGFEKSFESSFGPLDVYLASYWEEMRGNEWVWKGASPDFIYWKEDDDFLSLSIRDYMRLGDRLRSAGKYSLALHQYGKAEALEPENTLVLVKTAKTLAASGDREKADEYFARALRIAEDDFVCLAARADFLISGGRYEESAPLLLRALERNPFYRKGYEQLHGIYVKSGERRKAAEIAAFLEML